MGVLRYTTKGHLMKKFIISGMAVAMLAIIPATSMAAPAKDTITTSTVGSCRRHCPVRGDLCRQRRRHVQRAGQ